MNEEIQKALLEQLKKINAGLFAISGSLQYIAESINVGFSEVIEDLAEAEVEEEEVRTFGG